MLAAGIVSLAAGSAILPGRIQKAEAAQDGGNDQPLSPAVAQQIQALIAEKESRTPAQQKIDSQLLYALKMNRGESIANGVESLSVNVGASEQGRVVVDITGTVGDSLLGLLAANGASVIASTPAYDSIRAEVSLDRLETIAASSSVRFIQSKQEFTTSRAERGAGGEASFDKPRPTTTNFEARAARVREQVKGALAKFTRDETGTLPGDSAPNSVGSRSSEGDVTHRANTARTTFNTDGTGVRIGVMSNGVNSIAQAIASGDVPADVVILPGQAGSGDEGTAMLEIVHDLAPGAKLFYATASAGIASFSQNIRDLRNVHHCDIIVDDIFFFVETPFQDGQLTPSNTNGGQITQAVNDVTANGALYFSSAGNSGNKNDGTAGVWEGDFNDGGASAAPLPLTGNVHDFDAVTAGVQHDVVTTAGSTRYSLYWSDPLGGSANDYDFFALNAAQSAVLASSTNIQNGTQDPYEFFAPTAANTRLVVLKKTGAANRFLHVDCFRGILSISTPGTTKGHSCAADAYGVAATPAFLPFGVTPPNPVGPFPNPFSSSNLTEVFTSDGPRRIFYQPSGVPYTLGNFSSTGGIVRQKPDITAADGVAVTGVGAFPNPFYGTSAAAPHAAAIAGLIKSANPALTPAQIRTALISSAIDIETPGVDRDTGAGIVMAYEALQAAGVAGTADLEVGTVTATEVGGNANGFVEPGEQGSLSIQLRNFGVNNATGITATLTSNTPGVTVTPPGTSTYPDIPATNGSAVNNTPFNFVISSGAACPGALSFTLTVSYTGGPSPKALPVTVNQSVVINTTLDTTAPPAGVGYVPQTGTQVGRLARSASSTQSSCGAPKANPGLNDTIVRRFDSYTFTNSSASTICVTISLTTSVAAINNLQSAVYSPTFIPTSISENYVGDIAANGPGVTRTYSVNIPANTQFVVTVNEVTAGAGIGTAYTLAVDGLPSCATLAPANQPPVNTVPGPQTTNSNTPVVFSSANGNQISVDDPDADGNPLMVTLSGLNGTITLAGTTALSFEAGDGTNDPIMTFVGTKTDINNAMNGMSFTPTAGFSGAASLTINTNDQGFTGSGGAQSDSDAVAITVNAGGTIQFSSPTYEFTEGVGLSAFINVTRTGGSAGAASATFNTSDGTATAGQDYTAVTNFAVNFADGDAADKVIAIPVTNDALDEANETVNLTLTNVTGSATLGSPATAVLTIIDDDGAPALSINDVTVNEGDSGTTNAAFTVTLSPASGQTVTVNVATADNTAVAPGDYQPVNTTLTFNAGDTIKTVNVPVVGDTNGEFNEAFEVNLSGATNATIADPQGLGFINDEEPATTIQFGDPSLSIVEDSTVVNVTVTRGGDTSLPASVRYTTVNGTASDRSDYTAAAGTLTFPAGETGATIPVLINEDSLVEGTESFTLSLSNAQGTDVALGAQTTTTVTIIDDASEPSTNAIDDTNLFVRQQYHDFLNREADAAGLGFWTNNIESCGALAACREEKRIDTSAAFFLSIEFQETGFLVERVYKTAFGDATGNSTLGGAHTLPVPIVRLNEFLPDTQQLSRGVVIGQPGALTQLEANKRAYFDDFVTRPAFVSKFSGASNQTYVSTLLLDAGLSQTVGNIHVSRLTGSQVVPPSGAPGTGVIVLRRDPVGASPVVTISLSLSGLTSTETVAHIHGPAAPGANAPALITLPVGELVDFQVTLTSQQLNFLNTGQLYVDVHTQNNPDGEIRAQILAPRFRFDVLVNALDNGILTHAQVLRIVAELQELKESESNRAFVLMQYFGYLRRNPNDAPEPGLDYTGYDFWLQKLNQFNGDFRKAEMVKAFINSSEYRQRFGLN
jgi:hypothetical protein